MPLINQTTDLTEAVRILANYPFIAVDTEFLREHTYYPKLCLVQIATKDHVFLFDVLAEHINLTPLWELMTNPNITKVFHDARQDIETIYHLSGKMITPIFDTQIAAMALGYTHHIGYATLAEKLLGITLNKSSQFSAWDRRPLSDQQVDYARADVIHLEKIYTLLRDELLKSNRLHWLTNKFNLLEDPTLFLVDINNVWKKNRTKHLSSSQRNIAKSLTIWREKTAESLNLHRNRILKDHHILALAKKPPKTPQSARSSLHGVNLTEAQIHGQLSRHERGKVIRNCDASCKKLKWQSNRRSSSY